MSVVFQGENLSVQLLDRNVRSARQTYEIVCRSAVALCVPVLSDGKLVVVRQYRPAVGRITIEFPAGRLNLGEEADVGAKRELIEEAGFETISLHKVGSFFTAPHFSDEFVTVFIAEGSIERTPTPTEKEDLGGAFGVTVDQLTSMIERGEVDDAKSISAFMLAKLNGPKHGVLL